MPNVLAAVMLISLTAYVLLGGADFGGGVWDLLASGERRQAQRTLIADAIGPVWEANHVWLILVVVLLFTCFPPVFAFLGIVLHIPITLMLVGIVLRGTAFTFRVYDSQRDDVQRRWGSIFAVASLLTPVLIGMCIGAIASGRIGSVRPEGFAGERFVETYVAPWLSPFTLAVGLLALALFAFLAAVYLTVEAGEEGLREDFRRRALIAAGAVFVAAFGALLLAQPLAPMIGEGLTRSPWAIPLHVATAVAALTAIAALWTRRFRIARVAAAGQASLILWGWAAAQYPYLVPPSHSIAASAAPPITLRLALIALLLGGALLIPSLWYLFRIFKGAGTAFERMGKENEEGGTRKYGSGSTAR